MSDLPSGPSSMSKALGLVTVCAGVFLLATPVLRGGPPDADQRLVTLIDLMTESHGGRDALRRIQALRMEGTITTTSGEEGSVVRVSRGVGELASFTDYSRRMEVRILSRGQGWRGATHDALAPADGPLLAAMRMQSARLLAPWILDEYRDRASLIAEGDAGPLIGLDLGDGSQLRVRLHPETHRVVWTGSFIPAGEMTLEFTTEYSDFRPVGDLVLAHREENTAQRFPTATLVFHRLIPNPSGEDLRLMRAGKITGGEERSSD